MLESIRLKGFTSFLDAELTFAPGLNVIIGENGLGKSHIIKLIYTLAWTSYESYKKQNGEDSNILATSQDVLSKAIAAKLVSVFRPEGLGRLVYRKRAKGPKTAIVAAKFSHPKSEISFDFSIRKTTEVNMHKFNAFAKAPAVFIPPGDVISMMPFLKDAWAKYPYMLDAGYNDLSEFLSGTVPVGAIPSEIAPAVHQIEDVLDGKILLDAGRFYIKINNGGKMEMPLVAEGWRKFAMLGHLIANRSIQKSSLLLWDEPEANLNPRLIKFLAQILYSIATGGTQVIISTHSLFLLREFDLLSRADKQQMANSTYFALKMTDNGTTVNMFNAVEDLDPIVSLDEEINQSEKYMGIAE